MHAKTLAFAVALAGIAVDTRTIAGAPDPSTSMAAAPAAPPMAEVRLRSRARAGV